VRWALGGRAVPLSWPTHFRRSGPAGRGQREPTRCARSATAARCPPILEQAPGRPFVWP